MEQFVKSGNTCPAWEHEIISPLIAALPFWFRLWQCARRFWDTGQKRNLLNLGKYTSSLIVVIVSTQACPKWLVVLASAVATAYAAWWDICMDWGLTFGDLCFLTGARRSSGAGGTSHSSPASSFDAGLNSPVPGSPVQSFAGMNVRMGPGRQAVGQCSRAQSGT